MTDAWPSPEEQQAIAVDAWRRLTGDRRATIGAVGVAPPNPTTKTRVVRLEPAAPDGRAVIAKCATRKTVELEWLVYDEVLARLDVPSPRALGMVADRHPERAWLFVEEAPGSKFDEASKSHREIAARWLGAFHAATSDLAIAPRLPQGDPGRALHNMRITRRLTTVVLAELCLARTDRRTLLSLLDVIARVEDAWPAVERTCGTLPHGVVHGDFSAKNVRVAAGDGERGVGAFDWEMAAWGVAATDLFAVDAATWERSFRDRDPDCCLPEAEGVALVACVLRLVAELAWAAESLLYGSFERRMPYVGDLTVALHDWTIAWAAR